MATMEQAQQLAFNNSNSNIETEHILKALLEQQDSPIEYLLKKNGVNTHQLENRLDQQAAKLPKITTGEPAQNISRDANNVVLKANALLKASRVSFGRASGATLSCPLQQSWSPRSS